MRRPRTLVQCAEFGARLYRRARDLPSAVPGLLHAPVEEILGRLVEEERRCEDERLACSAGYRPSRHVQLLSALLAEAWRRQANASGSADLRSST